MANSKKIKQRNGELYISDIDGELHREILEVIMENGFLVKQENWNSKDMEFRATYDSFRIINLISKHLNK